MSFLLFHVQRQPGEPQVCHFLSFSWELVDSPNCGNWHIVQCQSSPADSFDIIYLIRFNPY